MSREPFSAAGRHYHYSIPIGNLPYDSFVIRIGRLSHSYCTMPYALRAIGLGQFEALRQKYSRSRTRLPSYSTQTGRKLLLQLILDWSH